MGVITDEADAINDPVAVSLIGATGSTNATGGLEIVIASATVSSNTLTSASTLRYEGVLFDLDMGVGIGYQLHDRSANASHATLSETGFDHIVKKRAWQLIAPISAAGYLGGSSRAILPANNIISALYTIGGSGITISAGETSGGTTLVSSSACASGVVSATLAGLSSATGKVYINYSSGSGSTTIFMQGILQ